MVINNDSNVRRKYMLKKLVMKNWIHTVLFCVLAITAYFSVYNITHILLTNVGVEQKLAETIGRLISSIGILVLYNQIFDIKNFGLNKENFFNGIILGGFLFIVTIINFLFLINDLSEYPIIVPSIYLIVIVSIEQVFIGIFEEFLFRGLILNTLLEKMKNNHLKSKIAAIVISSVLFGVVHFLNLFNDSNTLNDCFVDVCFATFIGIFLGALYLRTKNIWVVVFYHALVDLVSDLPVIFYEIPIQATADMPFTDAILNILSNTIFIFAGIFLARKLKE